jgi:hypothetical protein
MPAPPETASPTAEPEEQDLQVSMLAPSQMKEIIRLHEMVCPSPKFLTV